MLQLFTQPLASNQLPHKQWLPREMHPQQELPEISKTAASAARIQCWASSMNHQETINFLPSSVREHTKQENIGKSFPPWKPWSLDLRAHRKHGSFVTAGGPYYGQTNQYSCSTETKLIMHRFKFRHSIKHMNTFTKTSRRIGHQIPKATRQNEPRIITWENQKLKKSAGLLCFSVGPA